VSSGFFIVFRQGERARASRFVLPAGKELPDAFRYEGRTYRREASDLFDGDHFLTNDKVLVGFSFILGGDSRVAAGRLVRECKNVEIENQTWLKFYFTDERTVENDCCQFIFPDVYFDGDSDHIVLLNECPNCWTTLGFELVTERLPEPIGGDPAPGVVRA